MLPDHLDTFGSSNTCARQESSLSRLGTGAAM